ncbi:OXA-1090 family carbapenem-hydrolyzing class D beta-lactamase [Hyphomonas johnsonii]|nr:OXA-1090 family carbapenem-hydrolyzing class D beta-lactamase [Hyphomonas johnsonii]
MRRRHASPPPVAGGVLAALLALVLAACATMLPPALDESVAAAGADPATATLVIYRLEDERTWISNPARSAEQFTPASTSKIPHTLIALETGAVSGPDEVFEWDGVKRWANSWNQTQDFAAAFKRSTVWIYQALTPRIGAPALHDWLDQFHYGNADVGPPENVTQYWLAGPLAISAQEQVAFLAHLARRTLPLSARTYELGVPMMAADSGPGWTLYGKTGWKTVAGETDIGWYVGWLEQTGGEAPGTYVFAFNMDMTDPGADVPKRKAVVMRALSDLGALRAAE